MIYGSNPLAGFISLMIGFAFGFMWGFHDGKAQTGKKGKKNGRK